MHHLAQTYYHGQYSPEDSFNSYIYPGYLQAGGTNGEAGYEFEESPIPPKNKRAPKISAAWAERHAQGDYGQNEELSDIEPDEVVYGVDYGEMRFLAPIKGTAGRGHGSWDDDKFVCLKRLFESITPNGARLKNSIVINLEIVGN